MILRQSYLPAAFLLSALTLTGQTAASVFQKAPPAVDEALRKRASEFYQAHVDGKTRLAQPLVAEESADAFFNAQKPRLLSFEIQQVNYAKNFQEATVLILAERKMMIPLAGEQLLKVPMESYWKQVDGKWFWYIPNVGCENTPFGCVPKNGASDGPKATPEEIARKIKEASEQKFDGKFGFDKTAVELSGAVREVELSFRNDLEGWVSLKLVPAFSDAEFELIGAEMQVKPKSNAKVTVRLKKGVKVTQSRVVSIPLYVQPFHSSTGLAVSLKP